jgi:hypothetical protein
MKTPRAALYALFLVGLLAAPPAQAQSPWEVGPLLGVNLDNDELLLGAVGRLNLSSLPITLNPGFEFYPGLDGGSLFALNFDVQYQLEAKTVEPYVGGGISWARFSPDVGTSSSDAGLNVKGGVSFNPASRTHPYAEAVLNFANGNEALIFKAGFLFTVGG